VLSKCAKLFCTSPDPLSAVLFHFLSVPSASILDPLILFGLHFICTVISSS